ncbi:MAG: hypothetical protein HC800_10480 [Phormidesmis sp. RL_2_1]|nr:hypothetical protein [Phormidesmis sp. RL_2_1]
MPLALRIGLWLGARLNTDSRRSTIEGKQWIVVRRVFHPTLHNDGAYQPNATFSSARGWAWAFYSPTTSEPQSQQRPSRLTLL